MMGLSGNTSSGDGEDHQTKTSEEYSTEHAGRQSRACFLVHNVHPPPLQDVYQYKIRQKQDHKDFAAVQVEDAKGKSDPGYRAERESCGKTAECSLAGCSAERDFFGEVIGKKGKKQKREA